MSRIWRSAAARAVLGHVLLGLVLASQACAATYSPPMRMGIGRLPEALGKQGGAAQVAYGHPWFPVVEPRVAIGLTRTLDIDGNLFMSMFDETDVGIVMGSLALHWEAYRTRIFRLRLTGGFGVGKGATFYDDDEGVNRYPDWAGGFMVGVDLAFRFLPYLGIYVSNRYHLSDAAQVPVTHWTYHVFGIHGEYAGFYLALESGFAQYVNSEEWAGHSTIIYFALGYRWGPAAPTALKKKSASDPRDAPRPGPREKHRNAPEPERNPALPDPLF